MAITTRSGVSGEAASQWRNAIGLACPAGIASTAGRGPKSTFLKGSPIEASGFGGAPVPNAIMPASAAADATITPQTTITRIFRRRIRAPQPLLSFEPGLLDHGRPFLDVRLEAALHLLRRRAARLHAEQLRLLLHLRHLHHFVYGAIEEAHDVVGHPRRSRQRVPALDHIAR